MDKVRKKKIVSKVYNRIHNWRVVCNLSQIKPVHVLPSYSRSTLIWFSHLCLGLLSGLFSSDFPTKTMFAFLFSPCLIHSKIIAFCKVSVLDMVFCDSTDAGAIVKDTSLRGIFKMTTKRTLKNSCKVMHVNHTSSIWHACIISIMYNLCVCVFFFCPGRWG